MICNNGDEDFTAWVYRAVPDAFINHEELEAALKAAASGSGAGVEARVKAVSDRMPLNIQVDGPTTLKASRGGKRNKIPIPFEIGPGKDGAWAVILMSESGTLHRKRVKARKPLDWPYPKMSFFKRIWYGPSGSGRWIQLSDEMIGVATNFSFGWLRLPLEGQTVLDVFEKQTCSCSIIHLGDL